MSLLHLCVDLLDGLKTHTNHDEDRGAAKREVLIGVDQHEGDQRNQGHECQVNGAGEGDAAEHVLEVLGRGASGADARNESAVLLHVVGNLGRVERDRDVEVGEADGQQRSTATM